MDLCGVNSHLFRNPSSQGSEMANIETILSAQDDCDALFINYAAMAWHEMRRAWRGDCQSPASERTPKKQVMSWSTSYPNLLSLKEPFEESVPLSVVKFLVKVWEQEHL